MNTRATESPGIPQPRLLDQVRERLRYLHYSLRTEKAYLYWIRWFVRWSGMRHPRDMGAADPRSGVRRRHHLYEGSLQRAIKRAVASSGIVKRVPVSVEWNAERGPARNQSVQGC